VIAAYLFVIAAAYLGAGIGLAPLVGALALFGFRLPWRMLLVVWGWAAVAFVASAYAQDLIAVIT
jgi:uncharacterized membrane protein